jgi:hypothetical protein
VKGLTAAFLAFAATMAPAANIQLTSAYAADSAGNPITVKLGESFYMTARMHVDAPLNGTYRVRFDLPYATRTTSDLNYGGDAWVTWGPYTDLADGPIPVKVSIQSASDSAGTPLTVQIVPAAPGKAIEYFAPQRLSGRVGASALLSSGTVSGLTWYTPVPTSGGFQQVVSVLEQGSQVTSTPYSQPVVTTPKVGTVSEQIVTTASSVRVNASALRSVSFGSYSSLPSTASVWLRSEALIESKSTDVTNFVAQTLPSNYRTTMKPYDAVQKLFKAVVGRVQYVTTTSRPDAIAALRTGQGDCGFFSALFVASCRNIGVPARTVCGMTAGDGAWHVWSEFWMAGYGWVPADAAYSDGLCPDGSMALYFGVIPELNSRVALTYGFDHTIGSLAIPMLQSPALWATSTTKVSTVQAYCSLALSPTA